jgi:hypothetical protein
LPNASFFVREAYTSAEPVDLVIETGVVNYAHFENELAFAREHLYSGGFYILSVAGTGSLRNRLRHESGFSDFRSYAAYDKLVQSEFAVRGVRGCGFFIPYLWRLPALARVIQRAVDSVAGILAPDLCHEKVYLLQKR